MTSKNPLESLAPALPSLTSREAIVVWEFLEHIAAAVWDAHEAGMLDVYAAEEAAADAPAEPSDQDPMDDVPF